MEDLERNWVRQEVSGSADDCRIGDTSGEKSSSQAAEEQATRERSVEEQVQKDRESWDRDHVPKELDDEWLVELYFQT